MWDAISAVMNSFNDFLWGWFMIILLLGTHIFLTIRTKFVQRKTFKAIKLSVTKDPDSDGDISPFQALATALASTIGTGNIIGVGTAIALGGPGAVLWCWLTGVFGIATKYSESLIGVKYRVKTSDGRMLGGAANILRWECSAALCMPLKEDLSLKLSAKSSPFFLHFLHCLHPSASVRVFRLMQFQTL